MPRVLITGGAGYIGASLVKRLVEQGWYVTRLIRPGHKPYPSLGLSVTDIEGDIGEPQIWEKHVGEVEAIIHLAAQTSTYFANSRPLADEAVNLHPMIQLLEDCRSEGRNPFILYASTVTVIGQSLKLPVCEDQVPCPITVYDLHKWMAEEYLGLYCRLGHARGATLRLANVYGPSLSSSGKTDRGVLNTMIRKALAGQTLTIYGSGEWIRDYVYIDDVINAILAALEYRDSINGKYWIIASGHGSTLKDVFQLVADRAAQVTGQCVTIEHVEPPANFSPIETRNFIGDIHRFSTTANWRPIISLEEGIDRTIEAFLKERGAQT